MTMGLDWPAMLQSILLLGLMAVLALSIPMFVGVYVYYDAKRRGMNAAAWTLAAVLAPALAGFIIYLLVRTGRPDLICPQCGGQVAERYTVCPRCGAKLRRACPGCAAPAEQDWKVCPHCAVPLDGTGEGVTPPVRRKDRGLKRVLVVVVAAPVLMVAIAVGCYMAQSKGGSASIQKVTLDEYDQLQPSETVRGSVHRWLDGLEGRTDRAYALRYDLPGEYEYENKHYFLIYVPGGGNSASSSFGVASGLFAPAVELELEETGDSGSLFCVMATSEKAPGLRVTLGGKRLRCEVREVDYNPTTFLIYPDYSQLQRDEVLFLPERITVIKLESTGKGSGKVVDSTGVTDEDTLYQLMAAIDGGERLGWEDAIYQDMSGLDMSGGFQVVIEYQVREQYLSHDAMARLDVFEADGVCYLVDRRINHGDNFRRMDGDFYGLLESLFV